MFNLSEDYDIAVKLVKSLDWYSFSLQEFPIQFFEKFESHINWIMVSKSKSCTPELIKRFHDRIDFQNIDYSIVSKELAIEFKNKINWQKFTYKYVTSFDGYFEKDIDFFRRVKDDIYWGSIGFNVKRLSIPFIREFQDKLNWNYLCSKYKFKEEELIEFQDRLVWSDVAVYQEISFDFIKLFMNKLPMGKPRKNNGLVSNKYLKPYDKVKLKRLNDRFKDLL